MQVEPFTVRVRAPKVSIRHFDATFAPVSVNAAVRAYGIDKSNTWTMTPGSLRLFVRCAAGNRAIQPAARSDYVSSVEAGKVDCPSMRDDSYTPFAKAGFVIICAQQWLP